MFDIHLLKRLVILSWIIALFPIIGAFYIELLYWLFYDKDMLKSVGKYSFVSPPSFLEHWKNGVCGFGKSTAILLSVILLSVSMYLTLRYISTKDIKDEKDEKIIKIKKELKIVFYILLAVSAVYFILQLIMNSTISGSIQQQSFYGMGLFEYFIPYYILVIIELVYMYYLSNGEPIKNEILLYIMPVIVLLFVYTVPIFGYNRYVQNKMNQVKKISMLELEEYNKKKVSKKYML